MCVHAVFYAGYGTNALQYMDHPNLPPQLYSLYVIFISFLKIF